MICTDGPSFVMVRKCPSFWAGPTLPRVESIASSIRKGQSAEKGAPLAAVSGLVTGSIEPGWHKRAARPSLSLSYLALTVPLCSRVLLRYRSSA